MDVPTSSRRRYAAAGALLAAGAPLGLWALDRALSLRGRRTVRTRAAVYAYVGLTTPAVFAAFGWALGRAEDRRRASAREVALLRDEQAAIVAHHLRAPIAALVDELDALRRRAGDLPSASVAAVELERLARAARQLDELVAHLLDAAELDAARVRLTPLAVSLPSTVRAVIERLRPSLGHPIEVEAAPSLLPVWADPLRLEQIVTQLLDHAARSSDAGRPIHVALAPENGGARLTVRDEGPGVGPRELAHLFDRYRPERAGARRQALGLFIVRGLVEAHGGTITVESAPGRGSAFHVWLPTAPGLTARRPGA